MRAADWYRRKWQDVGAVGALALGGLLAVKGRDTTDRTRALAVANWAALMAHQFEEYGYPGWGPGQFNARSDEPDRYPLNAQMAVLVNTAFGYPYWALPAVFPNKKWLMMGPVNGGMLQVVVHAVVLPKFAKDRWSPGVLTASLLHVPIGIAWYRAQAGSDDPLTGKDIARGAAWTGGFIVFGLVLPHKLMPRRGNPYPFDKRQLGRHAR
jgi:Protein of unknown function with HXXEE motif